MILDPLLLSRLQFAWVVAFHILLPAFTIGLASYIALLEALNFATGRDVYFRLSTFWTRIFAISFGMGVVSGIVMPFQFGTNWSRFSDATSNVLSPLLAYEGLTAFFLEAAFLGVLLFGRRLVPRWAHLVAALMVAAGTLFSAFWILSANSWMQTPVGYEVIDGRWDSVGAAPLTLFAVPDEAKESNRYAVDIPYLGSLILTHDVHGNVRGLKEWAPEERPPVAITFFAFRVMVGIGLLMLALVIVSWWMRAGRRLYDSVWFLRCCQAATPLGFIAVLAGWTTTEVGRQPWTVYGIMRTADSVSPSLTGQDVLISLIGYAIVYLIIFPFGLVLMGRLVRIGPLGIGLQPEPVESGRPDLPVRALPSAEPELLP